MLALMQEFFQQRLQTNASPALMKALLITAPAGQPAIRFSSRQQH